MTRRAAISALALLCGAPAAAQSTGSDYVRVSTGLIAEVLHHTEDPALEWFGSARIRQNLGGDEAWGQFRFAGRAGLRLLDERGIGHGSLDRERVRELSLTVTPGPELTFGRFAPEGGGFRLIDGVGATAKLGDHWRVGAYGGEAPDPFNTRPALRFGGGPTLHYDDHRTSLDLLGEVLAAPEGLDRASAVVDVHRDVTAWLRATARADVLFAASDKPVQPADLRAAALFRLGDLARADLTWRAWSAAALMTIADRDPAIGRYRDRLVASEAVLDTAALDTRLHQQLSGSVRLPVAFGDRDPHLFRVAASYRPGDTPDETYAVGRLYWTVPGLFAAPLDLTLEQQAFVWGGGPGLYSAAQLYWEPAGRLALDGSVGVGVRAIDGQSKWTPTSYGDLYADLVGLGPWSMSAGYAFSNGLDLERWATSHTLHLRLSWRPR